MACHLRSIRNAEVDEAMPGRPRERKRSVSEPAVCMRSIIQHPRGCFRKPATLPEANPMVAVTHEEHETDMQSLRGLIIERHLNRGEDRTGVVARPVGILKLLDLFPETFGQEPQGNPGLKNVRLRVWPRVIMQEAFDRDMGGSVIQVTPKPIYVWTR